MDSRERPDLSPDAVAIAVRLAGCRLRARIGLDRGEAVAAHGGHETGMRHAAFAREVDAKGIPGLRESTFTAEPIRTVDHVGTPPGAREGIAGAERLAQAKATAAILGDEVYKRFPWAHYDCGGSTTFALPTTTDPVQALLNRTWTFRGQPTARWVRQPLAFAATGPGDDLVGRTTRPQRKG